MTREERRWWPEEEARRGYEIRPPSVLICGSHDPIGGVEGGSEKGGRGAAVGGEERGG